jgi:uncharacterized membrane protein
MKRFNFFLLIIILFAAAIWLAAIFNWGNYCFDELVSVSIAQKPLGEMWHYLKWEMHPPLHYYFLHFWLAAFGSSEISARLSSFCFGILSIISLYFLGKELFKSKKAGLYASFVFSLSALVGMHVLRIRMYAPFILLTILSFYFFYKSLYDNSRKKKWYSCFYVLITILALYTHITAVLLPLIQLIFLVYLFCRKSIGRKEFINFSMKLFVAGLAYLPWFLYFLYVRFHTLKSTAWYFYDPPPLFFMSG